MDLPLTDETMHRYARETFAPVLRGENTTMVWVPMCGRRTITNYIIDNITDFQKELPNHKKYILVYIEPLELTDESMVGYMRLLGRSYVKKCQSLDQPPISKNELDSINAVFNDEESSYSLLLDTFKELLHKMSTFGYESILFLGEFDELNYVSSVFFGNLKSLWNKLYPSLHFVFLLRGRISPDKIQLWGEELSEIILQNVVFVPLFEGDDVEHIFKNFEKTYSFDLNESDKKTIIELCGGHVYMIKVACRLLAISKDRDIDWHTHLSEQNYELKSVASRLLKHCDVKDRITLRSIAFGDFTKLNKDPESLDFLLRLKLVVKKEDRYELFGKLFKNAITKKIADASDEENDIIGLSFNQRSKEITLGGINIEEQFTSQEFTVLQGLLTNENKVINRDEIAKLIWGEQVDDKYSDWAIDQLISKIRKKLKVLGSDKKVITIRGKGYMLAS